MNLNRYTIVGGVLISLPILTVLLGMVLDIGLLLSLAVIAVLGVLMACFWFGWTLIEKGMNDDR